MPITAMMNDNMLPLSLASSQPSQQYIDSKGMSSVNPTTVSTSNSSRDSGQPSSNDTSSPGSIPESAVFDLSSNSGVSTSSMLSDSGNSSSSGLLSSNSGTSIILNRLKSIDSGILMTTTSSQPSPSPLGGMPPGFESSGITSTDLFNDHSAKMRFGAIGMNHQGGGISNSNQMQMPSGSSFQMQQQQFKDLFMSKDMLSNNSQGQFSPLGNMNQGSAFNNSKMDFDMMLKMNTNNNNRTEMDKEDKLSLQQAFWGMGGSEDNYIAGSNGGSMFGPPGSNSHFMVNNKRAITGGHSLLRGGSTSPFIGNRGCGGDTNPVNSRNIWSGMGSNNSSSSMMANGTKNWMQPAQQQQPQQQQLASSNSNPWNQALANQKMGLAPTSINAMGLAAGGGTSPNMLSNRAPLSNATPQQNSMQSLASSGSANPMYNMFPKKQQHRIPPHKLFDLSAVGGGTVMTGGSMLSHSGSGDALSGMDGFGPSPTGLEKSTPFDNFKMAMESGLLDMLKPSSMDGTSGVSMGDDSGLSDQYSNFLSGMSVFPGNGVFSQMPQQEERFSRKVFVGGLPPDIDEEEITAAFRRFGPLVVDWPHKAESKSYFPPKGYCFLLFQDELSVQCLIEACIMDESKYYWCVSSPTIKDKPVQIRPWNLGDSDFVMDGSQPLDPRKTIFVGGVPRPLRAIELAMIMDRLYGGVCYAGIDTDPELKYPKGAGRVAFSNQQSYISAISARFVQLQHVDIDKRVEVKPYVLDDQMCDECQGSRCAGKFAPFFCASVTCLQYYCEQCWAQIHSRQGREYHKPLVKEGADRPRTVPFRW